MKRRSRIAPEIKMVAVLASMSVLAATVTGIGAESKNTQKTEIVQAQTIEPQEKATESELIRTSTMSPVNFEYPYNTMSADWGGGDAPCFYNIPKEYEQAGGCFPEVVQVFTYCLCRQNGVSYPMVLALIERESRYKYDVVGDDGRSKGYMQIYQKFHQDRMEKLGCDDLLNPYQNIRVGIDFLAELTEKFEDERLVLMYYNRGGRNQYGTGALDLWEKGIYETEYSKEILERKAEIEKEIGVTE